MWLCKKMMLKQNSLIYDTWIVEFLSKGYKFNVCFIKIRNKHNSTTLLSLKFIYSEKATKILRNLHLFLTGTSTSQKKVDILQKGDQQSEIFKALK